MGGEEMSVSPTNALAAIDEEPTFTSWMAQSTPTALNGAVLAALLGAAAAGTGGIANPQALVAQSFTSPVACVFSVHVSQDEEDRLLDTQAKIVGIRHYLSLNMTDLARILKVGRPTVYSWTTGEVLLHSAHRKRLDAVYEIAREWRALSSAPLGNLVREPVSNGMAVMDLLSADRLDLAAIRGGMRHMAELQGRSERRLTVAQAAERAGVRLASRPRRNWRSAGDLGV
jgi:hypothetical protein